MHHFLHVSQKRSPYLFLIQFVAFVLSKFDFERKGKDQLTLGSQHFSKVLCFQSKLTSSALGSIA